jgi:cytochrome oxidase Cu insertion factor (SCO1/SenC/PrrC family)
MTESRGTALSARRSAHGARLAGPFATALLGLLVAGAAGRADATGTLGEAAADFILTDTNGQLRSLSSYRGNVVVLFLLGYG